LKAGRAIRPSSVRSEIMAPMIGSAHTKVQTQIAEGLMCVLLFSLINPFLSVFILAVISTFRRVPTSIFIASASISFALFFYSRDYGVDWYFDSGDDVPGYMYIYRTFQDASFTDLIENFIETPNGRELLWQIPWWALMTVFDASDNTFAFVHYLVIFVGVFLAILTLSRRYLIALVVVYFFLTPISIDSIAHIWRQQLAFSMLLAGVGLYLVRGMPLGKWLIYFSPLLHMSLIFFVLGFVTFLIIKENGWLNNKLKVSTILLLIMIIVPFLSTIAVTYLDAFGLDRIMSYFIGSGADKARVYMVLALYVTPLLVAYFLLKNDDTNNLIMILCFSVFSIVSALPAANGIYDRLLMFVLPLLGIYLYRCLLINFSPRWQAPFLTFAFITGMVRLYLPTRNSSGPMHFLAFGHAFDPLMGVLKMLGTL
jgi:hypothetical protein